MKTKSDLIDNVQSIERITNGTITDIENARKYKITYGQEKINILIRIDNEK